MLLRRCAFHMLMPGGLLGAGALWLLQFSARPPEVTAFLPLVPALVLVAGMLLGWRFNRTRLIYVLLLLAVADLSLKSAGLAAPVARAAVGLLLPINLLLISCYAERGLVTPLGFFRLGLIGIQPCMVHLFCSVAPQQALAVFTAPLFLWPRPFFPSLPHPALAATVLAGGLLLVRILRRPSALETGFFWVLICTSAPLLLGIRGLSLTLWFAVAGVIMTAALIEMSHGMAFRDELTGLPGRRALNEELLKVGRSFVVAMVDVDHFKKVNDSYGHYVGDQVLKMVAGRLAQVTGGGLPFRFGGEEFTVLFPGRTAKEVLPHLEALREGIGGAGFVLRHPARPSKKPAAAGKKVGSKRIAVTVSIGVAERRDGCLAGEVIQSADQALYKAKQSGRNRVCVRTVAKG